MFDLKQSTAITWPFFVHDVNGDGVTGLVDAGFTKRISKGGAAFAAMTVTITEMENGWYSLPLSTAHTDTLGALTISISHASAKRANLQFRVNARVADDFAYPATTGRSLDVDASGRVVLQAITHTGATVPTVTTLTNLPSIPANWITTAGITDGAFTAAKFAAASLNGKGDWNIGKTGYSLTQSFPANFAALSITAGGLVTLAGVTHTGAVIPTVSTLTGHTPQTGDSFARIGATGSGLTSLASAANLATVAGYIDTEIGDIQSRLPAALIGGRMDSIASVVSDKTGYALAVTPPTAADNASATWSQALPGAFAAGTAGNIVGNNLDAKVSEVGGVSGTGALNVRATGFTLTTGVETNSYTDTWTADATDHILDDTGNVIDGYYEFDVGSRGVPVAVTFLANLQSANDALDVLAYNWTGASWEQVGTIPGTGSTAAEQFIFPIFQAHVGTGADIGTVRVRVQSPAGGSNPTFNVKHLYLSYAVVPADSLMHSGGVVSATSTTLVLDSTAPADDTLYPALVVVTGPAGLVQSRRAESYTGSTKTFTVATPWTNIPTSAYTVQVFAWASVRVSDIDTDAINAAALAADAVAEIQSGLGTAAGQVALDAKLEIARAILQNKTITNPTTGVMTVFANDGTTPLFTAPLYEDAAALQTYRGQGAERRERLA